MPTEQPAPRTRVHAFTDDALGDHDAVGLAAEIRAGRVSRQEAVEAAIARTRRLDGILTGLACDRFQDAVEESQPPPHGFFDGLPTFVKDNCDVAGLPTQQGARAFVAHPARKDGDFARMIGLIGTTTIGKTRLSEFGFSASAEFVDEEPVRNPWLTDHTSGASSAGSAAFVAGGAVPMAHANDGGGSIRIPAACTGLVGLKPTRGRIADRQAQPRDAGEDRARRGAHPDRPGHRGVRPRVRAGLPQPEAATGRRRHRARPASACGSRWSPTRSAASRPTPRPPARSWPPRRLLERLGHTVESRSTPPVPDSFADDFLALLEPARAVPAPRRQAQPSPHLRPAAATTTSPRGWRRTPRRTPGGSRSRSRGCSARTGSAEASSPTTTWCSARPLALVTPELGWLDPEQPYETVIDRLMSWVAFTPLQNATGDPAISLPTGLPRRDCRSASRWPPRAATTAACSSWPTSSRRPSPSPASSAEAAPDVIRNGCWDDTSYDVLRDVLRSVPRTTDSHDVAGGRVGRGRVRQPRGETSSAWAERATRPCSS